MSRSREVYDDAWLHRLGYRLEGDTAVPQPRRVAEDIPEDALLTKVRALATAQGFLTYHTHDSRRSEQGFPDLTFVKPGSRGQAGRLLFVELKSAKGKLTHAQHLWLDFLRHSVPGVETYLWRPNDWPEIEKILCGRAEES